MLEDEIRIGDVFRVGAARVEVTQPRMPCYKLGIRMGMERFPKLFMASGRSGFYLMVVEEGEVGAGDRFEPVGQNPDGITVRALWHLAYRERDNLEGAKAALRLTTLGPEWRQHAGESTDQGGHPRRVTRLFRVSSPLSTATMTAFPYRRGEKGPGSMGQALTSRLSPRARRTGCASRPGACPRKALPRGTGSGFAGPS